MTRWEPRVYRLAGALLAGAALFGLLAALASGPESRTERWSAAQTLDACRSSQAPGIAFPSVSPTDRTGDGALVWADAGACAGAPGLRAAMIDAGDRFAPAQQLGDAGRDPHTRTLELTGAEGGRLLLAAGSSLRELDAQGQRALAPGSAGPVALATAYRGQTVSLYARAPGGELVLRRGPLPAAEADDEVERVALIPHPPAAVATALDYRNEAFAAWAQSGGVYARALRAADSPPGPAQRLGSAGANPALVALVSDDGRAIVAWMTHEGARTRIYAVVSQPGISFGPPTLLESYGDPGGVAPPAGSLRLIRLSSGRVVIAWPGVEHDRYAVRLAHVSVAGVQPPLTLSRPGAGALLEDLVAGPRGDWLALWAQGHTLYASAGGLTPAGLPLHAPPEAVARDVADGSARAAFDPDSDRAIAVWRTTTGALATSSRGTR